MRYCRFLLGHPSCYGAIEDRAGEPWIVSLMAAPEEDLAFRLEHGGATCSASAFQPMPLSAAELLAPVTPSKIVCVGRNYRDHVKELGHELPAEPLFFLKPPSSLLSPGGVVRMPAVSARVDYEGELALVIGRRDAQSERRRLALGPARLHPGQRRDRPRPAKQGRPMDPRQGLRHFLPRRPLGERRARPRSRTHARNPRQWRSCASTARPSTSSFPFPNCWPTSPP